jgi:beta-1,4-mannosyl-glycoprotein beta-1,4-N-acetylglucosaminyltransferase
LSKVYDCFTFFNEMDLLEIRLNELEQVVDYFVIVESTRTFQKQPKPLYLDLEDERIIKFKDKIIHIVVDDFPNFFTHWRVPKTWDYENHQRNAISRVLVNAKPDDIIIISDVDEIPNAKKIADNLSFAKPVVFQQRFFYYFLNFIITKASPESCILQRGNFTFWRGSVMVRHKDFNSAREVRNLRNDLSMTQVEEGGWHFSYIGGIDAIIGKLKSFSHAKEAKQILNNVDDKERIAEMISSGHDLFNRDMSFKAISLSEPFPKYMIDNITKYENLLCQV